MTAAAGATPAELEALCVPMLATLDSWGVAPSPAQVQEMVGPFVAEIERLQTELGYRETLQRQLDIVDEVLGWKGTGRGRVQSIRLLIANVETGMCG